MPIYHIKNEDITLIKERQVSEKEIQNITEKNLEKVFSLDKIASQFSVENFRIDTLAFNKESNSFVIIEYKKGSNFSVIDQGIAYLQAMLNQRDKFLVEYNEATNSSLRRQDMDWSQSKIIFIAEAFNAYQQSAIGFQNLPIELWEIKFFEDNIISYNRLMSSQKRQSTSFLAENDKTKELLKEIKSFVIEDHLKGKSEKIKELFYILQEKIKGLGSDVREEPQKYYIAYKTNTNFVDVEIQQGALKLWLNMKKGTLQDPKSLARDVSDIGVGGNGDYEIKIPDDASVPYIFGLIEQAYQKSK